MHHRLQTRRKHERGGLVTFGYLKHSPVQDSCASGEDILRAACVSIDSYTAAPAVDKDPERLRDRVIGALVQVLRGAGMDRVDFICQKCKKPLSIDASLATKRKDEVLTWETKHLPADFRAEDAEAVLLRLDHITEPTRSPVRKREDKPSNATAQPPTPVPASAPVAVAPPVNSELLKAMDLAMGCETSHSRGPSASFSAASFQAGASATSRRLIPATTSASGRQLTQRRGAEPAEQTVAATVASPSPTPARELSVVHCTREEQLQLFDRAGEQTPGIDHPLCRECGIGYLKELLRDMQEMEATNAAYQTALNALALAQTAEPRREAGGLNLDDEEKRLLAAEAGLDAELSAVAKEKAEELQPRQTLGKAEEWFVQRVARAEYEAHMLKEQHAAQMSVAAHTHAMLTDLKATNILDHVFHIWFDGYFGTINGLRLGRLASQPVDWTEINAAWGETVLLLVTMSRSQQCTFQGCTLVPLGNTSRVDFPDKNVCELYGSSDLSLGKFFWGRRYDAAIVAVLNCVKQLADHIAAKLPNQKLELPYKIDAANGKIGPAGTEGLSVKYAFSSEDLWTRALKYMLANLKWILVWIADNSPQ